MADFLHALIDSYPEFFKGAWATIRLSIVAIVAAVPAGAVIAGMSMSRFTLLRGISATFIWLIRGTPLITQIFILYFGLTGLFLIPGFWAAAIALGVHNSAYIGEIFRSGFQSVPDGLTEASRSLGMGRVKTLRRVQGPLALRTALPSLGNQFIIAVKDSSLAAFVTVTDLFQVARQLTASEYAGMTYYVIVAIYYLIIVLILTFLVGRIEHRLSAHRR